MHTVDRRAFCELTAHNLRPFQQQVILNKCFSKERQRASRFTRSFPLPFWFPRLLVIVIVITMINTQNPSAGTTSVRAVRVIQLRTADFRLCKFESPLFRLESEKLPCFGVWHPLGCQPLDVVLLVLA